MDRKDSNKTSREKFSERRNLNTRREKLDLRRRLRQNKIKSQIDHPTSGISPNSKNVFKVAKMNAFPPKRVKKSKGKHNQSINFTKREGNVIFFNFQKLKRNLE
jgi:hypothetical protein